MKWASAVSDNESFEAALDSCIFDLSERLGTDKPDLLIVFASPHHAENFETIPKSLREHIYAANTIGCSAGGVIGNGKEIEQRHGLSLTGALLPDVEITPFRVDDKDLPDLDSPPQVWEELTGADPSKDPSFLILTDPFTIRSENLLMGLDYAFETGVKIGGMASGGQFQGSNILILNDEVYRSGGVGLALNGNIVVDTIVAQGCRPIGIPMRVTKSDRNLLLELDDRPALDVLKELYGSQTERDQELVRNSLFLGVVMDEFKDEPQLGDFLIRNIVGMDPKAGALGIGELLREGQIVQFHLRDALTSAEELAYLLTRYTETENRGDPTGALMFSCLGRGMYLYGQPDHDTKLFRGAVGEVPLGGFFCNGEIGPVSGTTYLHGYT
ncbi:hypothetical protein FIM12_08380, partial [SAR202 cluster bacterium AD-804-J14_MRT_500m]|nr:hypothetical protein [SAR202 cluster bacterium AD-804-J14_MRT_500m]